MFSLKNKVAIVTGASQGIGKEISLSLAKQGANVICISRNEEALKSVVEDIKKIKGEGSYAICDVTNAKNVQKIVEEIILNNSKIDILVNNAGITQDSLLLRMSEQNWDSVINTNLKGSFNFIKTVSKYMIKSKSGKIINISSVVGLMGNAGQTNYAASKAGLIGLTKSAAKELAVRNIQVNCLAPGYISTEMTNKLSEDAKENLLKQIPLNRIGSPSDISNAVLFLCANETSYITGQTITIDGGMVMN